MHKKYRGFTLGEVLITLGVIGVVAAITIPTLINNYEKIQTVTALKKVLSMTNQAYSQIKYDNGGTISGLCTTNDSTCLANMFKTKIKYIKEVAGVPSSTQLPECWNSDQTTFSNEPAVCLVINDGMSFVFDMEWSDCSSSVRCGVLDFDINGLKSPNRWGKDRFQFIIFEDKIRPVRNGAAARGCNDGAIDEVWFNAEGCAYKYLYQE